MLDFAAFEDEIQSLANERNALVLEMLIDELLTPKPETFIDYSGRCTYARNIESYVKAKVLYKKINNADVAFFHYDQIQRFRQSMENFRAKMYENPCKTCSTCQRRKRKWPN